MRGRIVICVVFLLSMRQHASGQIVIPRKDTTLLSIPVPLLLLHDSSVHAKDTLSIRRLLTRRSPGRKDTALFNIPSRPAFLRFTGGYAGYIFNYRSVLDTPYAEKNLAQHQVVSTLDFSIKGMIPIRVNSFIRRSNSAIFRDITDIQVAFDAAAYRNQLAARMREQMLQQAPSPDTLAKKLYGIRQLQLRSLGNWLQDPLTKQKLIEANEIVRVPKITYNMRLSDSVNERRADSLRKEAALLLELYTKNRERYERLAHERDSLKGVYDTSIEKINKYRRLLSGSFTYPGGYDQWKQQLQEYTPGAGQLPTGERWLLGVRNFGIGRNTINTSELTAKNLSINGVHFEYNSWYYLGLTAGLVDYRFLDLTVHRVQQPKQYMYMLRAGLGRLEKNYFIVTLFGGQKQLLTSVNSAGISPVVKMTGLSTEAKWQLERNTFLVAEAAQSFSPPMPGSETITKSGWDFSDKTNKALSLKFSSWIPSWSSRIEAQYKFTGANFQSFNSFQTLSQLKTWYVKAEQNFFSRQLKLTASLRTNDLSNPYIVQNYKSNTVFKSLGLTFHKRGLPVITAGYMPMSQLTMVGDQLEESRFQTFNAGISHFYRLGQRQAATNMVYTKFFNSSADSGFIYYNSANLYLGQSIFFRDFTATVALSHSQSTGYQYDVLDGNVDAPLSKAASIGMGAKLHRLNQSLSGVGGFVRGNFILGARDKLYFQAEKGYLPGSGTAAKLAPNVIGTVQYMKTFR
ncbi:MAG TPA: hypothetical protein VHD83_22210 [Puia sp.]|nr:hypothetical protein [Puia sp.]